MEIIMTKDKTTKNTVRYADGDGHNIYLNGDDLAVLGNPEKVKITIEKA